MFSRQERLQRDLFPAALAGGRRASTPHLSAVLPRGTEGYAVVVSKKVARLSTTRHRLKRRLTSLLRARTPLLPPSLILFPKTTATQLDTNHLAAELDELLAGIRR